MVLFTSEYDRDLLGSQRKIGLVEIVAYEKYLGRS